MGNVNHHQSSLDQVFTEYPNNDVVKDDFRAYPSNAGSTLCQALGQYEIRLVSISEPGTKGPRDIIHCTTRITDEFDYTYTAVSYTWGSPIANDERYKIELDGRVRLVAKNLWRFLEQSRDMGRTDWFWIDALSINQDDPWERNCQVGMMSWIFSYAKEVVVWLGPAYGGSEKAMASLKQATWARTVSLEPWPWETDEARDETHRLCERRYWERLWVYQELRSARQIVLMCGNDFLPWCHLEHATSCRILGRTLAAEMISSLNAARYTTNASVWHLISTSRHLHCADPRDRVYALMNCADSGRGPIDGRITIDYTISTTALVNIVLRNICLEATMSLADVLRRCQELIVLFDLEPESVLEVTKGVFKGSSICTLTQRSRAMLDEWPEYFPDFDILSRWARNIDKRTICRLLLQHMTPTPVHSEIDLWVMTAVNAERAAAAARINIVSKHDSGRDGNSALKSYESHDSKALRYIGIEVFQCL